MDTEKKKPKGGGRKKGERKVDGTISNGSGAKRKLLDKKKIEELAALNWTIEEICAELGCGHDLIYSRYKKHLDKGRARGSGSVKRRLHLKAMEGDTTALIWLSKIVCGYREPKDDSNVQPIFNVMIHDVPRAIEGQTIDIPNKQLEDKESEAGKY